MRVDLTLLLMFPVSSTSDVSEASADAHASSRGQEDDCTTMKLVQIQLKEEMTVKLHTP